MMKKCHVRLVFTDEGTTDLTLRFKNVKRSSWIVFKLNILHKFKDFNLHSIIIIRHHFFAWLIKHDCRLFSWATLASSFLKKFFRTVQISFFFSEQSLRGRNSFSGIDSIPTIAGESKRKIGNRGFPLEPHRWRKWYLTEKLTVNLWNDILKVRSEQINNKVVWW